MNVDGTSVTASASREQTTTLKRRVLGVASGVHALHDGFTDLIYVLLPVWQSEFGLSYAALGTLRMLYAGAMASLQVPAASLARRVGGPLILALGTALAAGAYLAIGLGGTGFAVLAIGLVVGGSGSATQHPIGSSLIASAYEDSGSREALGTYNFAGDLGKMALPAITAGLLAVTTWRHALGLIGGTGLLIAAALPLAFATIPGLNTATHAEAKPVASVSRRSRFGFPLLLSIGILDSATRMGFLAFLPFILRGQGASEPTIGLALTLTFAGGAAGKLICGILGARIGVLPTVLLTEIGTAAGILLLPLLSLSASLACLPAIGIALNGTSSVLYGSVPELVSAQKRQQAFGVFYTATVGGGAVAPALYGLVGDAFGPVGALRVVASVCLMIVPLAVALRASMR